MSKKHHLNFIILHDGENYHLFERLGKKVPYEAYNPSKSLKSRKSVLEILENSEVDFPENFTTKNPENFRVNSFEIEHDPIEVMFNG